MADAPTHVQRKGFLHPRSFNGSEDPINWLRHFELFATRHGWISAEDKRNNFTLYLQDEAEIRLFANPQVVENDTSWEDVKTAFLRRFQPGGTRLAIRRALLTMHQGPNEITESYLERYYDLAMRTSATAMDEHCIEMIIGLKDAGSRRYVFENIGMMDGFAGQTTDNQAIADRTSFVLTL